MTPADFGFVLGLLLKHRELTANPVGRALRVDEARAARILSDAGPAHLDDFEDMLNAMGFSLRTLDGLADLAIPPRAGIPNSFFVLTRKRGEDMAPFVDTRAFLEDFRDRRKERAGAEAVEMNKADSIFWLSRLWLSLQYFFYDKINRTPGNIYQWRSALVSEKLFTEIVSEGVEKMGNEARPQGEAGLMWDVYWRERERIPTLCSRFLKSMDRAGMIEEAGSPGEYRQTLVAAVDMAVIGEQEIAFLLPAADQDSLMEQAQALITGDAAVTVERGNHAADQSH